ncbi:transcription antitermination factor NusB [bacterium]|nr:transcription antitermination factor NusB [bacterium]
MGRRRQSREIAFKILFQIDVGKLNSEEVIRYFLAQQKASEAVLEYARELSQGVIAENAKIDKVIKENTHKWKLERIAGVDRSLLRLAIYELLRYPHVPKSVIMNEAIELAKKYSTEESSSFINGILDKIGQAFK